MAGNNGTGKFSGKLTSSAARNSTSRLSASAEPFALRRPPAPQSKARSFDPQSSCFDYTSEGLGEFCDLSNYEAVVCGGEFSGSNWCTDSGGSLLFAPIDSVEEKEEKKTNASSLDQSSEKEGISAYRRSKSLDGTRGILFRASPGVCAADAHARSQTEEQMAVTSPALVKSGHPVNPTATSIISNISLNVKPKDPAGGGLVEGLFILVDKNDLSSTREPDEDSPCWRGTMNSHKSPFTPSQCRDTKFPESTSEACWTLNPMAPDFIPQSAGTIGLYLVSPEESPEFPEEENITSREDVVTGITSQVPRHDTEDISVHEALVGISEYLSTCLSLDTELVVSTMHDLSELLVRKSSESHFLSEPLLDKVQGIIQNISIYAGKGSPGRSFGPANNYSGDTSKMPITEFRSNRRTIMIATPELDNGSSSWRLKTDSSMPGKKVWDSCTFMGNIGADIAQANCNAPAVGLETDRQVAPQTLLYKSLWLQATEELRSMKGRSLRNMKSAGERFSDKVP